MTPVEHLCSLADALPPADRQRLAKRLKLWPRCLALAVIAQDDGRILVDPGYDPAKDQHFYRLLGGGIDMGERATQALARELREELGAEATVGKLLGTVENLFTFNGVPGHEIIMIFQARFDDAAWYRKTRIDVRDTDRAPTTAVWKSVAEIQAEGAKLYPDGLAQLVERS